MTTMMSSLHVILKITILISYITIVSSSDGIRRTSMEKNIPEEDSEYLVPSDYFEVDGNPGIYYAICKKTSPDMHTCTVVRETPLNSQASLKTIDSCKDIRLNVSDLDEANRPIRTLFPMTDGKVALVHTDHSESVRFTLVDVMHCDKSNPVITKIPYSGIRYIVPLNMRLAVYEHSFELMMQNETNCATNESTTCLVKYNYAGERLGARPLKLGDGGDLISVQVDDESKGSYAVYTSQELSNDKSYNISHVAPDGEVRLITEGIFGDYVFDFYTSYAHGLFSICWKVSERDSVRCLQVDREKVLINVTLSTKTFDYAEWFAVHNIQGGGILLASGNNTIGLTFQLRHITKDARDDDRCLEVETVVKEFEGNSGLRIRVMEDNENEEICFHFVHDAKIRHYEPPFRSSWKIQYERVCVPERLVMGSLKKKV